MAADVVGQVVGVHALVCVCVGSERVIGFLNVTGGVDPADIIFFGTVDATLGDVISFL